jgi:hypothetical protein
MPDAVSTITTQLARMHELLDSMSTAAQPAHDAARHDDRHDDGLRVLLVGCEQLKNIADATQALVMTEMGREALALDAAERGDTDRPIRSHEEFVPDEISVLLSCTKASAAMRYGTAWQAERHAAIAGAWRSGAIDARKVSVTAEQIQFLPAEAADRMASEAARYAADRTPTQLREWLRRKVLAIAPDAAEQRRRAALPGRRVVISPGPDGMSELWAWLPSVDARRIQQALNKLANGIGADDPRTMDQRRADIAVDLLLGRATPGAIDLQLVVPLSTVSGSSDEPASVPGLGPITAAEARALIGYSGDSPEVASVVGAVTALMVDPASGTLTDLVETHYRPSAVLQRAVQARDVTCRFPGCRRAASGQGAGTDLDHTVPWPAGPTAATNLAVLCRRHHRLKHAANWKVTLAQDGSMTWTTPSGRRVATEPWSYIDTPDPTGSSPDPPTLE